MKTAKEITKRSTLLATIRSEFPKSTAIDLENELFDMINKALMLGGAVGRSEQLCHCGKQEDSKYSPFCSLEHWHDKFS